MRHKQPDKLDSLIGWAATFIVAALILMFLGLLSSVADAAPVCRVQRQVVVQQAVAYTPVLYKIGQSVEQEAAATLQFRHSEEYIELQQLRGFKAGVDAVAAVSGDRPSSPSGLAMKGGDNPGGAEQPHPEPKSLEAPKAPSLADCAANEIANSARWPTAEIENAIGYEAQKHAGHSVHSPADPAADPYATLKATCAKCHSGDSPKGDLWLDGSVSLDGPDAATKRDAIVSAIRTGRMPPNLPEGERLPLEKREAIEDELYGVEVVGGEQ